MASWCSRIRGSARGPMQGLTRGLVPGEWYEICSEKLTLFFVLYISGFISSEL